MAKNKAFTQSDSEIAQLIQEVRQEVATLLKSESPVLQKSEGSASASETMAKDEFPPKDAGSSGSDSAAPASAAPESAPADLGSASSSGSPSESSSSSSSGSSSGSSSSSDQGDSPDQLQQAYEQLSPEEQLMHLQALKAAIMKHGGGDPASAAPAPQGPPPAAPMGADAGMPAEGSQPVAPAFKSEAKDKEIETLKKRAADAEAKFMAMESQTQDLEKSVTLLTGAFETMLTKPIRKAVTAYNYVPDTIPVAVDTAKLTKDEITKTLTAVTKRPDLKKSDRDLINSFYSGKAKIADLGHFFK